jgi:hypothetical protein
VRAEGSIVVIRQVLEADLCPTTFLLGDECGFRKSFTQFGNFELKACYVNLFACSTVAGCYAIFLSTSRRELL